MRDVQDTVRARAASRSGNPATFLAALREFDVPDSVPAIWALAEQVATPDDIDRVLEIGCDLSTSSWRGSARATRTD